MSERNETRAAFILSGFDCDPTDITRQLEVEPTQVIRQGEQLGARGKIATEHIWRLQSMIDETDFLERHVESLLDQLPAKLDRLRQVTRTYEAQFALAVHVYGLQAPSIALGRETVRRMAALDASFDVDLYCRRNEGTNEQTVGES